MKPIRIAAFALIAAGLLLWLWPRLELPVPVRSDGRALLPDVGGPIQLAAGSLQSARQSALRNTELTNRIVNALPEHVSLLLLVSDREAFTVQRNPWPGRIAFLPLPEKTALTIWPQDPFLVLAGADGTTLLTSRDFGRAEDREMAAGLAGALGYELEHSELRFDGGNLVSDGEHAFVGADTIALNVFHLEEDEARIVKRFESELGRPVLVVGPFPQPVAHIDMVLTPIGERRLVLADPGAGADLAERALRDAPEDVEAFERESEAQFFGHPSIDELRNPEGEAVRAPELIGTTSAAIEHGRELAPVFDALASELRARGYTLLRVPFLMREPELPSEDGDEPRNRAGYPVLTYNNVLLERSSDGDRVYLPEYGFGALDRAARDAWRTAGYETHPVRGLTTSAMYGGALRCAVKVLARSER